MFGHLHRSQQFFSHVGIYSCTKLRIKCLAEGRHAVSPVSIEHATIRPRVEDSVTEPPRCSLQIHSLVCMHRLVCSRLHAAFLMTKIMTLVPCDNICETMPVSNKMIYTVCDHRIHRLAWTATQSDQTLHAHCGA